MDTSLLNVQPSSFHARSNSLPSRKHPLTSPIDENLNRLSEKGNLQGLKNLKQMENQLNKDVETGAVISTLKQVEAVTISVLESVMSFISGPEAESKSSPWSLFSKLMHQKKVTCVEEEQKTNEIANAEATLRSLIKCGSVKNVENVQKELENSEMNIQDPDEGLESLFRRLIKVTSNCSQHPQLLKSNYEREKANYQNKLRQKLLSFHFRRDNDYRSFKHPHRLVTTLAVIAFPLTSEADVHLSRLASSKSASKSSLLILKLSGHQDLHNCIEKLLQLPFTDQQILSQEQQRK
ncbi:putative Eukaryotic translation initiation factor 3 subunit A [Hibiscus syriacus]|uniref:Eukaryotic translation initiation factor 3 subunit A n=1 Tax=Hibiscus syriacus TaxID=106335 RepID=A0A6A3AYT9_HIBSY|nr:putative Eukaryotic translation initiation factor 3 subunit A [Hibiscus syriacus]